MNNHPEYIVEDHSGDFVKENQDEYLNSEINPLTYKIIGAAMEVHNIIGRGFLESVYKDCLSLEFAQKNISFQKEKKYEITYKGVKIPHHYYADFIIEDKVILEVKAQNLIIEENSKQLINYLAVSNCRIGLLINFGETTLKYKRFILTK